MKSNFLQVKIDCKKVVLSSDSLFYKTENFIKQTRYVSGIDFLLSKLSQGIIYNISQIVDGEKTSVDTTKIFTIETIDKLFKFAFKLGYQIDNRLSKYDIIFCEYYGNEKQKLEIKVDEYVRSKSELIVTIMPARKTIDTYDFNKLYALSMVSGVNLPKLSAEQREIVETVDKNVLVQGVAGSGKTNICIDKIIYTACKNYTGKTLYTTFSRGLLTDTKLKVDSFKEDLKRCSLHTKMVILYSYQMTIKRH